jgi:adenosylcobyric acid synthase
LFPAVVESYRKLSAEHDIVVLEGAGSPAEINLKAGDIVNMRMAMAAEAKCLLVGDIDRGGVFASLLGTLELLDPDERALVRGFIVNKFRGDPALLLPGIRMIEDRIGIPCFGVVPYLHSLGLEEEDGVGMERVPRARSWSDSQAATRRLRVGVIAFPHLSNFTDFDALAAEPSVHLAYARRPEDLALADVVVLPGTKQTLDDLGWLRETGLADAILRRLGDGAAVIGVCGGMQMLGRSVEDAAGVESSLGAAAGLGVLPIRTELGGDKVTGLARGRLRSTGAAIRGYEIHLGETRYEDGAHPLAEIVRSGEETPMPDGAVARDGRAWGTYLHGIFDDDAFRHDLLRGLREQSGLAPTADYANVAAERGARLDRLAKEVRDALDMPQLHRLLELNQTHDHNLV